VLGRPAGHPELRRVVGYTTQAASVYADLTVTENLRYFAALLGAHASDIERALVAVDMAGLAGRTVGTLSGGERSRVSLAAALLGDPQLLVLDEPTVGLDGRGLAQLLAWLTELREQGVTIVLVTHDLDLAARADRTITLDAGAIIADGPPAAVVGGDA